MSRLEDIEARLASLEREAALLRRFGDETHLVVGDVIRFTKTHHFTQDETSKSYTYAAIKTPVGWYLTGQPRKPQVTYDELIQYIVAYPIAEDVEVATTWRDVTRVDAVATAEATKAINWPTADTRAAEANSDDDVFAGPLPKRRPAEFGRGRYRPVEDEPELEPEVQTPVRDPNR